MECAPVFTTSLFMQPPVQSFASAIFHLTVQPPYLFTKPSQQPLITLLSSTPQTSSQFRLLQGANEQSSLVWNDSFNPCFTLDRVNNAENHEFYIAVSENWCITLASDEDADRNDKPFTLSSLLLSAYYITSIPY